MTQIREIIENLCVVLKYNGLSDVTAETLRLAKFDKQQATKPMWDTLSNILIWLENSCSSRGQRNNSQNTPKSMRDSERIVRFCKHEMFTKGYRVRSFFVLPEDMLYGSREVLLGVGWLMAKENLLQSFVSHVQSIITEDLPFTDDSLCKGIKIPNFSVSLKTTPKSLDERIVKLIQEVVLIKGKLHSACRSLLATKNEYGTILKRIHSATLPFPAKPTSSHLSALDVYLLYNQKELIQFQERLEMENLYLNSLIMFQEKEELFWKWLESAIDLREKNISDENSNDSDQEECLQLNQEGYRPSKQLQNIKTKQVELSKHLQVKETLYQDVSQKWKRYRDVVEQSKEMQEQFQTLLACLDQEVLEELEKVYNLEADICTDCEPTPRSRLSSLQGTLQLVSPITPQKKKQNIIPEHHKPSSVFRYIQDLQQKDEHLKEELKKLKKEHNDRLAKVALTLDDMVCIPPKESTSS